MNARDDTLAPVQLVTAEPAAAAREPAASVVSAWVVILLVIIAVGVLAARIVLARRRAAAGNDPADEAFRRLARRVGLSRAEMQALSELAVAGARGGGSGGPHPVALVLSRHAFRRCAAAAGDRALAGELELKIFGGGGV